MITEDHICRVCRGESTEEEPLFYPCKCSGSIKYVHETCLLEWLRHSNKRECELCGYSFKISPVYAENMPTRLPMLVMLKRILLHEYNALVFVLRATFITFLWVILLPNLIVLVIRFYFWCAHLLIYGKSAYSPANQASDLIATTATSVAPLASNSTTNLSSSNPLPSNNSEIFFSAVAEFLSFSLNFTDHFADFVSSIVYENKTSFSSLKNPFVLSQTQKTYIAEYLSEVSKNSLSGLMITLGAVLAFMGLFFLRDWIITNDIVNHNSARRDEPLEDEIFEAMYEEIENIVKNSNHNTVQPKQSKIISASSSGTFTHKNHRRRFSFPTIQPGDNDGFLYVPAVNKNSANVLQNYPPSSFHPSRFKRHVIVPGRHSSSIALNSADDLYSDIDANDKFGIVENSAKKNGNSDTDDDDIEYDVLHDQDQNSDVDTYNGKYKLNNSNLNNNSSSDNESMENNSFDNADFSNEIENIFENTHPFHYGNFNNFHHLEDLHVNPIPININQDAQENIEDNPPWPANQVDEILDDAPMQEVAEDLLQALGFRGALLTGVQYLVLVFLIVILVISLGIWLPYILGKYLLHINVMSVVFLPLQFFANASGYIADFVVDSLIPQLYLILYTASSFLLKTTLSAAGWLFQIHKLKSIRDFFNAKYGYQFGTIRTDFSSASATFLFGIIAHFNTLLTTTTKPLTDGISYLSSYELFKTTPSSEFSSVLKKSPQNETIADIAFAVIFGYTFVLALATFISNFFGRKDSAIYKNFKMILKMVKVSVFVMIELVFFPLMCGAVINFCLVGLIKGHTYSSIITFSKNFPYVSVLVHLFAGVFFMYKFAGFVNTCRSTLRKGVLWFIRDPKNPNFQPMRDIVEKPVSMLFKKISMSFLIYLCSIAITSIPGVQLLKAGAPDLFPLDTTLNVHTAELPISIVLVQFVIPGLLIWIKPRTIAVDGLMKWYEFVSHKLRFSEFLIGKVVPSEMGVFKFLSWKSFILYQLKLKSVPEDLVNFCWYLILEKFEDEFKSAPSFFVPRLVDDKWRPIAERELDAIYSKLKIVDEDVNYCHYFFKHGQLLEQLVNRILASSTNELEYNLTGQILRVPKTDNIPVIPKRKIIAPVKYNGLPQNPSHNYIVIDLIAGERGERYLRRKYGITEWQSLRFKPEDYQFLFSPLDFRVRNYAIVFLLLLSIALVPAALLYFPLVTGKALFRAAMHYEANVVTAYTVGLTLWLIALLSIGPLCKIVSLSLGYAGVYLNRILRIALKRPIQVTQSVSQSEFVKKYYTVFRNVVFITAMFGVVIPSMLALLLDLYYIRLSQFSSSVGILFGRSDANNVDGTEVAVSFLKAAESEAEKSLRSSSLLQTFLNEWLLGILLEKSIHSLVFMFPNSDYANALTESLRFETPETWNIGRLYKLFVAPALLISLLLVAIPALLSYLSFNILTCSSWLIIPNRIFDLLLSQKIETVKTFSPEFALLDYLIPSNKHLFSFYCMITMATSIACIALYSSVRVFAVWIQKLRDEEYIVGRQLHNNTDTAIET